MKFMDAYKHLERLCSDLMGDYRGVSAYIDAMSNNYDGRYQVPGWDGDLKLLIHYRGVRNRIVHEVGFEEENLCTEEDVEWLIGFYERLMNRTDPLALYRKAMEQKVEMPRTAMPAAPKPKIDTQKVIKIDGLWIVAGLLGGVVALLLLIYLC